MKKFNIIAACSKNKGIGLNNKLPWKIREDMEIFKNITTNVKNKNKMNSVIMGRKTWESLPNKVKPLPNRFNIIVSSVLSVYNDYNNNNNHYNNIKFFNNLDDALNYENDIIEEKYVIGGQRIFNETINRPECSKIYLTEIDEEYKVDTYFPEIPFWMKKTKTDTIVTSNNIKLNFNTYENISDPYSDEYCYLNSLKRILEKGEEINDRTGTGTLSVFDENLKFKIETINPQENDQTKLCYTVPVLTTKNLYLKGVIWELIWFLRGETNAKWLSDRNVHIWDGHTSKEYLESIGLPYEEGELGPGYGHQWVNWGGDHSYTNNTDNTNNTNNTKGINQIKNIINLLKKNPTSRRAVLSAWNVSDLNKMALPPCHMMYIFKISDHNSYKPKLNCKVILRSNDMFLGSPFNILSASILTIFISRALNILPGEVALSITDAHVYKNHIEQVKKQINRVPLKFPKMTINKNINSYEDMTNIVFDDFKFSDYYHWSALKGKMAI